MHFALLSPPFMLPATTDRRQSIQSAFTPTRHAYGACRATPRCGERHWSELTPDAEVTCLACRQAASRRARVRVQAIDVRSHLPLLFEVVTRLADQPDPGGEELR